MVSIKLPLLRYALPLLFCVLALVSLTTVLAQTESRTWTRLGSPPPRITGIVTVSDTVLVSTESGAYSITTNTTAWKHEPSIPPGRLLQSREGEILSVGASVWLYSTNGSTVVSTNAGAWRVSTSPAHRVLGQSLTLKELVLTQATVRMPSGYDLMVTRGGVSVRLDTVWRQSSYSPFDGTRGIIGLVRVGVHLYAATERGIFCGEELTVTKANPFEPLRYKRFAWKRCDGGLMSVSSRMQVVGNRMLAHNAWFSSDSGRTWLNRARDSLLSIFLVPTRDSTLLAHTTSALLRSSDGGETWVNAGFALPRGLRWYQDFRTKGILPCVVGSSGTLSLFAQDTALRTLRPTHVVESRDGGITWQMQEMRGLPDNVAIADVVQSPHGILFAKDVAFQRSALYRSDDGGKAWQTLTIGREPETLAVHPTTGTLFLSGSPPMRSGDNGTTWTAVVGLPFRTSGRYEGASEFAFSTNNVVLLNIRRVGVFRSGDAGRTFTPQKLSLPDVYTLRGLPNGELIALSADVTFNQARSLLWISRTGGTAWERLETGFPSHDGFLLTDIVARSNNEVFALSSHGIFRLDSMKTSLTAIAIAKLQAALLTSAETILSLKQATRNQTWLGFAPNPAQNDAHITLTLPSAGVVRCHVFSMSGVLLQTLFEGVLQSGFHTLACDVSVLPTGQYFCLLQTETTSHVTPFLILR